MKSIAATTFLLISSYMISTAQTIATSYDDPDAYAVYDAIVVNEWPVRIAKAGKLVIQAETSDYPAIGGNNGICLTPAVGEESTLGPLIEAYAEANKRTSLLRRKFDLPYGYEIVPQETIAAIFKEKGPAGWKDFYKKYPNSGGSIELSAVGFNSDKTLALVYVGHSCGGLCGGGTYHLLKKTDGKWSEIKWNGGSCAWAS
jgi:hypothetical protein